MNQDCPYGNDVSCGYRANKRIFQQCTAKAHSLFRFMNSKACEQHDAHRMVGRTPGDTQRSVLLLTLPAVSE